MANQDVSDLEEVWKKLGYNTQILLSHKDRLYKILNDNNINIEHLDEEVVKNIYEFYTDYFTGNRNKFPEEEEIKKKLRSLGMEIKGGRRRRKRRKRRTSKRTKSRRKRRRTKKKRKRRRRN